LITLELKKVIIITVLSRASIISLQMLLLTLRKDKLPDNTSTGPNNV